MRTTYKSGAVSAATLATPDHNETIKEFYTMAINNSTVLNTDKNLTKSYSDFACEISNQLYTVKAMVAGARTLVNEHEALYTKNPALLDATYLLDDTVDRMTKLAADVSRTEFIYQSKTETLTNEVGKQPKSTDVEQSVKDNVHAEIDAKLNILQYAMTGLREEAQHSQITVTDIKHFEQLIGEARYSIREIITGKNVS